MLVKGLHHVPAALPPGTDPLVATWRVGAERIKQALSGIEPRSCSP
jgi:hypothetical protein